MGGMFGLYMTDGPVRSYADVTACDTVRFGEFFHGMLNRGVYLAPSAFEAGFVSASHTANDIDLTIEAARAVWTA